MNFPDAWATITGIAGILSLFLAINEKFSSWKKFTIPVCTSLVGFALGRLTAYSAEIGHRFRFKSATCSDGKRPAVLIQIGHPVGAKRRWFFSSFS